MRYDIDLSPEALDHLQAFRKVDQTAVLDGIQVQLQYEPSRETKNRKYLGTHPLAPWELRIGRFRVFYEVLEEDLLVIVAAIGVKDRSILRVGGEEIKP